ncbi:galactokinase [Bacteroidota bacterium]
MDLIDLKGKFYKLYGNPDKGCRTFFAPGRVNLIGEHTDYNGGYVFPCALQYGTYLIVRLNNSETINFATTNFDQKSSVPVSGFAKPDTKWVRYPLGVLDQIAKRGFDLVGMDLLFSGDVPNGAGLSSSASIEMVTGVAVNALLGLKLDMIDLIKIGQKAENEYVGVNCGIMDQFASGMGKTDHAVLLDCATLDYEQVPLVLGDYAIVISNTNKRRGLADSKYNERRGECESSVEAISKSEKISFLGELSYTRYLDLQSLIQDKTIQRRAHHVVSENQRCLDAVKALKQSDLELFGELMNASHDSLRYDYEVTGVELDTLVEEARKIEGVIGSRMTGAGFGGCTVSLVDKKALDQFTTEVGSGYHARTGLKPDFYMGEVGNGARELL